MIEINGVSKKKQGKYILKNITVCFEKGKIHGIVGENGSGKTMLLRAICGLVRIDEGEILVDGKKIGKEIDFPQDTGVIIENPGFISTLSGYRNLEYLASIRGKIGKVEIEETMKKMGLDPFDKKKVGKYSLGMKQRLGMAQAIMENPDLLLLDEPMNALDKKGAQEVRQILLELKEKGKTILMVSHNWEDMEVLCDDVYKMIDGKLFRYSGE